MARLRYNGLTTTLGAALTTSGTTITFAAALTYSHGVAVPTITAGDTISLSILDSSGNLSEVVSLTAYTTGTTTGTITRAQEGTTGVAHSTGDSVIHAPTVADYSTGGGAGIHQGAAWMPSQWYPPVAHNITSSTTITVSQYAAYFTRFVIPNDISIGGIAYGVTAGGSGTLYVGLYTDVGGLPGTLVAPSLISLTLSGTGWSSSGYGAGAKPVPAGSYYLATYATGATPGTMNAATSIGNTTAINGIGSSYPWDSGKQPQIGLAAFNPWSSASTLQTAAPTKSQLQVMSVVPQIWLQPST